MKDMYRKERLRELYSLLDRSIESYEERLKLVEPLLEIYIEGEELEAITNYLLFSKDIDRGAKLEHNTYDSDDRMEQKHYKSSSLELELENGEVELDGVKKNYRIAKELKYNDIKKEDKLKHSEVKDYEKLLKYVEDNNIKKIRKNKIREDIVYICDRNTIRFKEVLEEEIGVINLDSFIYTDEVIEKFIGMSIEKEIDISTDIGVIRYDFEVALNKAKKIMNEQELKVIECMQLGYNRQELKLEIIEGQVVDASVVRNRINSSIKKIKKYL